MRIVLHILIVLEMIAVNLTTVHLCSKRKRSLPCLTAVLAGFTALLVGVMLLALSRFPDYGNGNGLFVLVGFLYLPVLMWLYGDRFAELLMKMCSTWVYTMLLFSLSVHIAHLFPDEAFDLVAFIAQTGLYLLTLYPFLRFVRKRFLFILQNIPKPASKLLLAESLVWFLTMIVINYTFVQDYRYPFLRVISLLALAANVVVSYTCIQTIVGAQHRIEKLRSIVYIDGLTGLKNRSSLYIDCTNWIESGEPFILIFMDLNRFKEVNDRHGHLAGDEYLVCFSEHLQKLAADDGAVYRLSGDEFVCLYKRPDSPSFAAVPPRFPSPSSASAPAAPFSPATAKPSISSSPWRTEICTGTKIPAKCKGERVLWDHPCSLPCPCIPSCLFPAWNEDNMRWSLACLPVVGLLGGGLLAGWAVLTWTFPVSPIFFGAVAALLPIILSGGFHMDGFLDATDAIFSRRDRDRKLEIMKDPHCGPFAVLSCAALLLLELGAWSQLVASPLLWPACTACVLSRCAAVAAGSRLPYAKSSTLGVLFAGRAAKAVSIAGVAEYALGILLLIGMGWFAASLPGLLASAAAAMGAVLLCLWHKRMVLKQFGGLTGDLLGYLIQILELTVLLILAFGSIWVR